MPRRHHKRIEEHTVSRPWITAKEFGLIILVGILAAFAILTSQEDYSPLGLISPTAYADNLPIITRFPTDVLVDEEFLGLNVGIAPATDAEQQQAVLRDPTVPPPIEHFTALNTRIGDEVALFWSIPEDAQAIDVYRAEVNGSTYTGEKRIVEGATNSGYMDTEVETGTEYEYRAVAINVDEEGERYQSKEVAEARVAVSDDIPPQAPTDVSVQQAKGSTDTLVVTWTNPPEEDLEEVQVYRSAQFGTRGELLETLEPDDEPMYEDDAVEPNTLYYYTVVAEDNAGNTSSSDFQIPAPGNSNPFTPVQFTGSAS